MVRRLLLAWLLCLPLSLPGQTLKLASVQISGSKRLPADKVAAASGLTIGEPVSLQDLQTAADRLAGLGLFEFVTYRYQTMGNTISVTFVVEETAKFRPCEFDNFVWLPPATLRGRLKEEIPLFTGEAPPGGYLTEEIKRVLQKILAEHKVQGRVVHVAPMSEEGGINLFRVEGVSVPVASLHFTGADKLGEKPLQQASHSLLGQEYSRTFLQVFTNSSLLPLYRSKGYLRASFKEPQLEYLGEAEGGHPVRVTFPVEEGEIYRVREIRWGGNEIISTEGLSKRIRLQPGAVADTVQLTEDLDKIRQEEYGRRGYIQAQLGFTPDLDDEALLASLTIRVDEGELYRFYSLVIEGLPPRATEQLTKKWKLQRGEPYDSTYAWKFMKEEVGPLMKRLVPEPRNVSFVLDRDDEQNTVTAVFRFR